MRLFTTCEACASAPAAVRVRRNEEEEKFLCSSCLGPWLAAQGVPRRIPLARFFGLYAPAAERAAPIELDAMPHGTACQTCRLSFEEFASTGLLGCGDCYHAFQDAVFPALQVLRDTSGAVS